jgi:hypothetical protein
MPIIRFNDSDAGLRWLEDVLGGSDLAIEHARRRPRVRDCKI